MLKQRNLAKNNHKRKKFMNYQKIEIKNNAKSLIEEYKHKYILLTEFIKDFDSAYKHNRFIKNLLTAICIALFVVGFITLIILERNKIYTADINSIWIVVIQILIVLFCFYVNKSTHNYRLVLKTIYKDFEKYEFLIIFNLDTKEFVDKYTKCSFLPALADDIFYQYIISVQDYNNLKSFAEGTIIGITMKSNECIFSTANPSIINDITLPVEYKKSVDENQKGVITVDMDKKEIVYYYRDEIPYHGLFLETSNE